MHKKPSEISKLALKIMILLASAAIMLGFVFIADKKPEDGKKIVVSNFATYDLVRAVTKGSDYELKMLVQPGVDLHHYEPSQQDMIDARESELFIYIGGESEEWADNIAKEREKNSLKMIEVDNLKLLKEDGEDEIDEHFWTSIENYQIMLEAIKNELITIDSENQKLYVDNAQNYNEALEQLKNDNSNLPRSNHGKIVIADRFPLKYLFEEYDFGYIAAFSGCAEDTEADPATLASIVDYVKSHNTKYILTIELSDQKLANTIKETTGAQILSIESMQNISKENFDANKTYVDLMRQNIETLRKVLE